MNHFDKIEVAVQQRNAGRKQLVSSKDTFIKLCITHTAALAVYSGHTHYCVVE